MQRPIYLDYMATTPVAPSVIEKMNQCLAYDGAFGNPASSSHPYGYAASELVDKARQQVALAVGAEAKEIVWTSGATESNNLALQGAMHFYRRQAKHLITSASEHKAVLDCTKFLESEGIEVTYLKPESDGHLDLAKLEAAIRPDTGLISLMHVNNETGVINDIAAIGEIAHKHGVKYHVDAAQSVGKVVVDLAKLPVDLMSFSAHKVYGPKGIGALFVRRQPRMRLQPLLYGGEHEFGLRSGTLPTHQIVGMGEAFDLASKHFSANDAKVRALSETLWGELSKMERVFLNTQQALKVPHCLNLRFDGVDSEALLVSLRDIAISTGSACNSANPAPSHVLLAQGLTRVEAQNSLRISLGHMTTEAEMKHAAAHISQQVAKLRKMSPVWGRVAKNISDH